jgi:hypothetical protein
MLRSLINHIYLLESEYDYRRAINAYNRDTYNAAYGYRAYLLILSDDLAPHFDERYLYHLTNKQTVINLSETFRTIAAANQALSEVASTLEPLNIKTEFRIWTNNQSLFHAKNQSPPDPIKFDILNYTTFLRFLNTQAKELISDHTGLHANPSLSRRVYVSIDNQLYLLPTHLNHLDSSFKTRLQKLLSVLSFNNVKIEVITHDDQDYGPHGRDWQKDLEANLAKKFPGHSSRPLTFKYYHFFADLVVKRNSWAQEDHPNMSPKYSKNLVLFYESSYGILYCMGPYGQSSTAYNEALKVFPKLLDLVGIRATEKDIKSSVIDYEKGGDIPGDTPGVHPMYLSHVETLFKAVSAADV